MRGLHKLRGFYKVCAGLHTFAGFACCQRETIALGTQALEPSFGKGPRAEATDKRSVGFRV